MATLFELLCSLLVLSLWVGPALAMGALYFVWRTRGALAGPDRAAGSARLALR